MDEKLLGNGWNSGKKWMMAQMPLSHKRPMNAEKTGLL